MTQRTITIHQPLDDVEITSAIAVDESRVTLDFEGLVLGTLRVRIFDPSDALVCERLLRSTPGSLTFRASRPGRYRVDVKPLGPPRALARPTWSSWGLGKPRAAASPPRVAAMGMVVVVS